MKLNITGRLLGLFAIAVLSLTSCGDDKDDVNPISDSGCQLTQMDEDGSITKYEYNSNGLISKVDNSEDGYEEYTLYKYDNQNRLVREEEWEDGVMEEYAQYTHSNGRISQVEWFDADGTSEGTATFKYDANNRVIEMTETYEYEEEGKVYVETSKMVNTYNAQGNLSKSTLFTNEEEDYSITYEDYDNKLSPMAALKGMFAPWDGISQNNPGKATFTYTWDGEEYSSVTTYAYSYNSSNLPTRITETTEDGDTYVSNFTYKCN